jgi:hypothetical protein
MFLPTSTLLSRSKKRRNLDFTWAGEPHDSPVGTLSAAFRERFHGYCAFSSQPEPLRNVPVIVMGTRQSPLARGSGAVLLLSNLLRVSQSNPEGPVGQGSKSGRSQPMAAVRTGLWVDGRSVEHPPAQGVTTKYRPRHAKSGWTANSWLFSGPWLGSSSMTLAAAWCRFLCEGSRG